MFLALFIAVVVIFLIYYKIIKPARFWQDKGIPYAPAWPLIGNLQDFILRRKHFMDLTIDMYNQFPNARYAGFMQFTQPVLMIRDIDLIKKIGIKDFEYFHDRMGFAKNESDPLLSKALISLTGEEWRDMRATLSPAFTSSKMRNMYILMKECADNFVNYFHGKEQVAVEMKEIFTRYTTDVIATTAFGISTDSVNEPSNEFFSTASLLFSMGFFQFVKIFLLRLLPKVGQLLKLEAFPRQVTSFFRSVVKETISKRESEGIVRPDLIHLLMQARRGQLKYDQDTTKESEGFATVEESDIGKKSTKLELTDDHIVAQALLFFFAGFETSSTAASFLAYELAVHPEIQKKLQEEIDETQNQTNGNITYDALLSMKYLDQVISEALRLWTPGFQTDRLCLRDYVIPPEKPGEKSFIVEKGITVVIPIIGIHRDEKYFADPMRFDPDRFNEENRDKIVSGSYMPFGIGPRNCIGSRFALLQVKTLIVSVLSKFDLVPVDKTEIPIKLGVNKMQLAPANGIWLAFKPRKVTEI